MSAVVEKAPVANPSKEELEKKAENPQKESQEQEKSDEKTDSEKPTEGEGAQTMYIQDEGFTIQIQCPNLEPFSIQVYSFLHPICSNSYVLPLLNFSGLFDGIGARNSPVTHG